MAQQRNVKNEIMVEAYRNAIRARALDNRIVTSQRQGIIGFHVPSKGQEIIQIALGMLTKNEDFIYNYYRDLALILQRGVPVPMILDQLLGNRDDLQKGRQMPDHFSFPDFNFSTVQSVVGSHLPLAVGAAYALKYNKKEGVIITTFGDGATSSSDFHAAMNMAAVFNLNVLFVCENNGWAISLPTEKQTKAPIYKKGQAYGIPGKRVDGNDLLASYSGLEEAFYHVRSGKGPYLIEATTYRIGAHSTSDDPNKYRENEIVEWGEKDPLVKLENLLLSLHIADPASLSKIKKEAKEEMDRELDSRISIPLPNPSTIFDDVYENPSWIQEEERRELDDSN